MKSLSSLAILATVLIFSPVLHAQIIWQAPTTWSGTAADISLNGTFVAAVMENYNSTSQTVGTTVFDQTSDFYIAGPGAGGGDGSGSNANSYLAALNGCTYVNVIPNNDPVNGVSQVNTFTLQNLTAGDTYQVQVWNVVGYAGPGNANGRETELSGVSPAYLVGSDFVLGTFTATFSGSQSFTMQGLPGGNYGEVDAVALRDLGVVPEPSTYAMLFAGIGALALTLRLRRLALK